MKPLRTSHIGSVFAGICLLLLVCPQAFGANTWDGGGLVDSNWSTPENWDNDTVPTFPVGLTFDGSTRLNPSNDLAGPPQVNGFTFASGAGAFTLSGNAITLAGNITNLSTNNQTIHLDMVFSDSTIRTITPSASGKVILSGNISGTGGFNAPTTSAAPITLSGENSFSGGVTFGGASGTSKTLNLEHASALGSGLFTWNPINANNTFNSIDNTSLSTLTIANNILFGGSGRMTIVGTNDFIFTGNFTNSSVTTGRRIQVNAGTATFQGNMFISDTDATGRKFIFDGAGNSTITGLISNYDGVGGTAGGVEKQGSGTLTLSHAANTYTGATTFVGSSQAGTIVVTKLANGGQPSSIGASSKDAANLGAIPNSTVGTLRYIGGGDNTDRLFTLGNDGVVFTIESSGTGALNFTNTDSMAVGGSGNKILVLGGSFTGMENTMAVRLNQDNQTGNLALRKEGPGTWNVTNPNNSYTNTTTVNGGTLLISGSGSINSTSGITVNNSGSRFFYTSSTGLTRNVTLNTGGAFFHSGSTNYSGTLTWTNGILGGTNWNGSSLNNRVVDTNRTISPGNSPGTAFTGSQTWGTNGSYIWEINNATGTAGLNPGWDLVSGTDTLTISATSANKFTIYVTSLTTANVPGDAVNFNSGTNYQWRIADFANPVSGFDDVKFAIDTSSFTNATPQGSFFSVVLGNDPSVTGGDNTQIYLTYTIPEPQTALLLGLGLAALLLRRRK